jgi:hypothetical protein
MHRQVVHSILPKIPDWRHRAMVCPKAANTQFSTPHAARCRQYLSSLAGDPLENLIDKPGSIRFDERHHPGNVHSGQRGGVRLSYRAASPVRASVQQ